MRHLFLLLILASPALGLDAPKPPAAKPPTAATAPAKAPAAKPPTAATSPANPPATTPPAGALKMMPPVGHFSRIDEGQLSPDGKWAVTISAEQVIIWEVATGRTARVLDAVSTCARWLNDSQRLLIGGSREGEDEGVGVLQLWDAPKGKLVREWKFPAVEGRYNHAYVPAVRFMDVSADQKRVLIITGGIGGALVCEIETGKITRDFGQLGALENGHFTNNDTEFIGYYTDQGYWYKEINTVRYNVQTGAELGIMPVRAAPMSWTKDGRIFVIGRTENSAVKEYGGAPGPGKTGIYDEKTGALLRTVEDGVEVAAFSPDGKWLAYGKGTGLKALEIATGKIVVARAEPARGIVIEGLDAPLEPPIHGGNVYAISWRPDGKALLSSGRDERSKVWSWPEFMPSVGLRGWTYNPKGLVLSPDGQYALVSSNDADLFYGNNEEGGIKTKGTLRAVDLRTGRTLALASYDKPVEKAAFLSDGKAAFVTGGEHLEGYELRRFDLETGALSEPLAQNEKSFGKGNFDVALSADERLLLADGKIFDAKSGQKLRDINEDARAFNAAGQVIGLTEKHNIVTWDAQTGAEISRTPSLSEQEWPTLPQFTKFETDRSQAINFVNGGAEALKEVHYEASVDGHNQDFYTMARFSVATGKILQVWEPFVRWDNLRGLSLSADGKRALYQDYDKKKWQLHDAQTGALLRELPDNSSNSLQLTLNSNLMFSLDKNSISARDGNGKLLYSYITMEDGDWLAFLPDGRFDGTQNAISKVCFSQGNKTYGLEQFAERFYQPGLISLVTSGLSSGGDITPSAVLAAGTPPLVKITAPLAGDAAQNEVEVTVEARPQNGGGVKAIRLYHNGRLVGGPSNLRGIVVEAAAPQSGVVTQKFTVTLAPGDNALRAVAYSKTDLESLPDTVRLVSNAPPAAKPVLRVLVVGVNVYRDATMKLDYARPDAEALADFLQKQTKLFADVKITRLLDEAATGEAIKAALGQMAKDAAPNDVAVIYLAGHGETATPSAADDDKDDARQLFYFLPSESQLMMRKDNVRRFGLSGPTIDTLVAQIPARRIFLIYDACKSGAAVQNITRASADEQQALALLARAQGIFVLTASTGQQFASEIRSLGHGILTYALLEGLDGKAAQNDSQVKVTQLLDYTESRVPVLAKEFRGREQFPVRYGRGQNFPLAIK